MTFFKHLVVNLGILILIAAWRIQAQVKSKLKKLGVTCKLLLATVKEQKFFIPKLCFHAIMISLLYNFYIPLIIMKL